MTAKLSARIVSIALASAMALSLFVALPAHAADIPPVTPVTPVTPVDTPESREMKDKTEDTESEDPTQPDPMSDEDLRSRIQWVGNSSIFRQADGTYRIGDPTAGGSSVGPVPQGLEIYYSQKITALENTFPEEMGIHEQNGYLIVPMDYSNLEAGNIALYLTKYPATGERKGAIVFNQGGPGGMASMWLRSWMPSSEYLKKLNENYDLVGMDPRGVKSSLPFSQCTVNAASDRTGSKAEAYPTDIEKSTQDSVNNTKKYVNSCFEYTGKAFGYDVAKRELFLRNVGTANAARDMDVLRSVLGEEKLNFIGISYGTHLGYVYAQNFPQNVGRFTLDGAMNPYEGTAPADADQTPKLSDEKLRKLNAHYLSQGRGFQDTYEQFAQWCYTLKDTTKTWKELSDNAIANDEIATCPLLLDDVQPHEGDVADDGANLATQQIQNILRPLTTNPLNETRSPTPWYSYTVSLNFGVAVSGVKGAMYQQSMWPRLAYALLQTHNRIVDESFFENTSSNFTDLDSDSAFVTVRCADSANPLAASVENNIRTREIYYEAAPFADPGAQYHKLGYLNECDAWPFTGSLQEGAPLENLPNILVVSTRHDPATPFEDGAALAQALFGTEMIVEGSQHGAFLETMPGYECANNAIVNYMLNGTIPADGQYPPICSVASFRAAAEVPDVPENPVTPPQPSKDESNPGEQPQNQTQLEEQKDENQVKTAGKTATKAAKPASRKLAQTGVNVAALSVVIVMVLLSGGVLVSVRRH